mmetsp:Transcript_4514/g.17784  ORF Transcript_4514/g.17784 Transcript_4514/m.17784 type:complete len:407 (-) Transcript_4514:228-1448(-)
MWKFRPSFQRFGNLSFREVYSAFSRALKGQDDQSIDPITDEDPNEAFRAIMGRVMRVLAVVLYYVVGAAVYTQLEERECDNQPEVRSLSGVNITIGDFTCENCILTEQPEVCIQKWNVLDAVYWATVTVTTVGYGDYAPATNTGRVFGFFYILFGLGCVLSSIDAFISALMDHMEKKATKSIDPSQAAKTEKAINRKMYLSFFVIIAVVMIGGGCYYALEEDFSFLDAAWWAFITSLTVGYGDLTIQNPETRAFSIFFIIVNVTLVTVMIGNLTTASYQLKIEKKRLKLLSAKLTPEVIATLDENGDGVDRYEFVVGMLKILEVVDESDVAPWSQRFDELDADGSGMLDHDDLVAIGYEIQSQTPRGSRSGTPRRSLSPLPGRASSEPVDAVEEAKTGEAPELSKV